MDNLCNVTTGKVRFSYVHLYKPYAYQQGQEEKYQATVLVPKSDVDTKARIDAAIEAAKQKGTAEKWNGVCPPIVSNPVYDGDGVRPSDGMAFGPECKGLEDGEALGGSAPKASAVFGTGVQPTDGVGTGRVNPITGLPW